MINIKSFPLQTGFYSPISWNIHSGFDRENRKENLSYNNEFGIGRTLPITTFSRITFLADIGSDNLDYYIKPNSLIELFTSTNSKLGFNSSYKQYNGDYFYQNDIYFIFKKHHSLEFNQPFIIFFLVLLVATASKGFKGQ